jgi:RNA polymerase sigma-70 factor (ECF subfamily)
MLSMTAARAAAPAQTREATPSFDEIYEVMFDFVWNLLRRLGLHDAELDDATQDVFMRVLKGLSEFQGRSKLRTWLGGIAVHVAADVRRNRSRRGGDPLPLPSGLADPANGPLELAAAAQALRQLQQLLEELPDEQREVFVLTEMEQLTAPEISEALGVNLNTVYSRLRLARKAFAAARARETGAGT